MKRTQVILLYILWSLSLSSNHVRGSYKFNSLNCEFCAPGIGRFLQCKIKAIDRNRNKLSINAILNTTVSELDIDFKMVKREIGGWHPFLYAMRVDACQFFKNRRKFFIPNLIYSFMKAFTNVNHTCPYMAGSEMSLLNWTPDEDGVLSVFPVDHGQYGLQTTWYVNKVLALKLNGSVLFFK
ncbi:uncharacterized protein LOC108024281 [Drosophila biarmipes]|uniref:uncharacterized protein LOC108024281 n=1 Tax=Drosophila biarmipes TaxID=125945 RepID=UPI001CDAFAF5|nr:uncharacterized protein LOC108024281 [Drosophila biarmipes]